MADYKAKMMALTGEERVALAELLDANGLTEDDLACQTGPDQERHVTHLEMFLHDYPKMLGLNFFTHIKTLCLIRQGIKDIQCLDECVQLEKLWVVENEVKQIRGLSKLTKLRELYLYSNFITSMENIGHLTNLEILNLADNYIADIADISTLSRLRELHLARNDITVIGDTLAANTALTVLNLADNAIGSLKEVQPLTRLPHLVDLCFADPMWGECPLAALCNYQTYILYQLPHLASLDTLLLADETKQLAEATFLKKQMYYNMRIKTMHRNARNIIKLATEGKRLQHQQQQPLITRLVQAQKELQRLLGEAQHYNKDDTGQATHAKAVVDLLAVQAKLDKVQSLLDQHSRQVGYAEARFEECAAATYQVVESYVSRMMLELETAGNIRLEEGKASDIWYSSCADLVTSRFNAMDYHFSLGVTGVSIRGVTRIHNRWLRTRFEKKMATYVDGDSAKKSMEYLFLGTHPARPGDMEAAIEGGLPSSAVLAAQGLDGAIVLSNNLCLADQLRLQAALELKDGQAAGQNGAAGTTSALQQQPPSSNPAADQPAVGRVMIAKVFLGRTAQDSISLNTSRFTQDRPRLFKEGRVDAAACLEGPCMHKKLYSSNLLSGPVDAVYRCKAGDTKQKLWYVFDNMLVLPEYIVDFEYTLQPGSSRLQPKETLSAAAMTPDDVQTIMSGLEPDLRPLARPLLHWLSYHFHPSQVNHKDILKDQELQINDALACEPTIPTRPTLSDMSLQSLTAQCQGLPLHSLTYLNLHSCGLRKLENMVAMKQLQVLILSFNELTRLDGLSELSQLAHLDAAHNMLRKVDGLKGLTSLQHLDMSFNQISKLEEVYGLRKYVSQITYLDLTGNGLCDDKSYRPTVLRKLTSLVHLDGRHLSPAELEQFSDAAGGLSLATIMQLGTTTTHRMGIADEPAITRSSGTLQASQIHELVADRRHIRRLQNLTGLVNLRRASFGDNQISHIEGLESCTALEELNMEGNRLGSIEGLHTLTRLKKLQLARNRLASLDRLSCCTALTQLSVEDNELTSLAGLEALTSLMELYAGNNRLQELREVQRLRELPKLIILDLSGNPCTATAADNYRLYVIFNVRKLKVLDGTPIDAAEQAAAKSKYSGRLTSEFIEEKLGHRSFERVRDLDVSGLKVRDVGGVFLHEDLGALQELNLDNNMLVEVSGLALLRELVVLKLNNNRLGEECTFNPRRMLEKNAELYKVWSDPNNRPHVAGLLTADKSNSMSTSNPLVMLELFPGLQTLQLGNNQIASISSLQLGCLTSLRTLFLNNNDITRIDGLEGLVNLQELVLDRNRIRYIDPDAFYGLVRLRELRLEDNGLRSLAHLHHLTALQSLYLGYNRISDAVELEKLACLPHLVEVSLINNPLSRKQGYRQLLLAKCPRLCVADDSVITFEEREAAEAATYVATVPGGGLGYTAMLDGMAGVGIGVQNKPTGQAIRLTNLDLASLAAAASQFGQVPGAAQATGNLGMAAAAAAGSANPAFLGLEGVGIRDTGMGIGVGPSPGSGQMPQGRDPSFLVGPAPGLGINANNFTANSNVPDVSGRDVWGRPTSTDKRGLLAAAANATSFFRQYGSNANDARAGRLGPDVPGNMMTGGVGVGNVSMGITGGPPAGAGSRTAGVTSNSVLPGSGSPARRQGLIGRNYRPSGS